MIIVSSRSDHRVRKVNARRREDSARDIVVSLAILAADRMESRIVYARFIWYSLIAEKSTSVVDITDIGEPSKNSAADLIRIKKMEGKLLGIFYEK